MKHLKLSLLFLSILLFAFNMEAKRNSPIQPWTKNPWYWQYNDKPILLLGASGDDNLFQWTTEMVVSHLDSMKSVGANYVRNTMSDRKDLGFEIYPFIQLKDGKYDLNKWNKEYWQRFERFLKETSKRDIIVQIEVWDRFDYSRENWVAHPYNPKNNVNYSEMESGLALEYPNHPGHNKQPFFFTTPNQQNNETLLKFQQRFVEKMLSYSLKFNHVLYCIDNETSGEEEWSAYWARFIRSNADNKRKKIYLTEMWDAWDLKSEHHKRTFDYPELYDFCDISQNNHRRDQAHWDNFMWAKNYVSSSQPRPINTVKTYGSDEGHHGSTTNGIHSWWRHVVGGVASARFHRPPAGLGLSMLTMNSIKAAREIEKVTPFWNLTPDNSLLLNREDNEAYLTYKRGETYIIFFPGEGEVELDLTEYDYNFTLKWMNVREGRWESETEVGGGKKVSLKTSGNKEMVAVLTKIK